jgi:hypothetical protein
MSWSFNTLGCPVYLCSKTSFYYCGVKCKGKLKGKQPAGSKSKAKLHEKIFFKIVAIGATSMYNFRFVSIFRKDVVIFAILRCC